MDLKLLKRRAEMLDAVNTGLHPAVVVGQLAERALYRQLEEKRKIRQ